MPDRPNEILNNRIRFVECPRDAMQGWPRFIATERKIEYLNALLRVGFDVLDFGSFVSPKAIPQMADTAEVIKKLNFTGSVTSLLAIIANQRGAEEACKYEEIKYLGFPFSISETFQLRNTNSSIEESLETVRNIHSLCLSHKKELVVYISMGFGNPYGDEYNPRIATKWVEKLISLGICTISVADTVGLAQPHEVESLMTLLIKEYPGTEFGVHLHAAPGESDQKIQAALNAGCRRFDGAIKGIGGCPMAGNVLVGNMNTEDMLTYFDKHGYVTKIDADRLRLCSSMAAEIFS